MGKKKYSERDWFYAAHGYGDMGVGENAEKIDKMMNRYGVKPAMSVKPSARNLPKHFRTADTVKAQVESTMRNDYDTRRTMEAAALAGDKKARKFAKGKGNMESAFAHYEKLGKKYGDEDLGQKLTMNAVQADRDKQTADYEKQFASQSMLNKKIKDLQSSMNKAPEETVEPVESEEYAAAKERLNDGTTDINTMDVFATASAEGTESPTTAFRRENEAAPKDNDQAKGAASYLDQYKKDVIAGGGITEAKRHNLENAANTVIRPMA